MSRRQIVCWLAVIALVAAACTSQDVSVGTTSTTSTAAVKTTAPMTETGAQGLAWSKVFDVPGSFVVESIVVAHDRFYALANDYDAGYYSPSVMWTSEGGTDWVELDIADQFSDGASVHSLAASEEGLLAFGFRPAPDGYAATAWYSADGMAWDRCDIGYLVEPAQQSYTTGLLSFGAAALGSNGAVVTATAFPGFDWTAAQQAAAAVLPADLAGIDPDRVGTTNDSVQVTVGPFVVYSESLESLGLGEVREAQRITNSPAAAGIEEPMTFLTADLENWTVIDGHPMDAEWVLTIAPVGDEYVSAASDPSGKAQVHVSSDGQTWEPAGDLMEGLGGLFVMGDRLLTDGWRGSQRVTLVSDDAGRTWEEVAGPDLSGSWITAAGPAGILATGTEGEFGWGATPEPTVIERDGYTVTFDSANEQFTVADSTGSLVISVALEMDDPMWGWGYTAPEELVFDFEDETAAVQDPSTGETLFTLTFADLDWFEGSMISYGGEVLLFSPDAEHWTVAPLDEAFGPETMLGASVVGTDRVVAVVGSGYPDPYGNQSIWVGIPVAGEAAPTVGAGGEAPEVVMGGPAPEWEQVLEFGGEGFTIMLAAGSGIWAIAGERNQPSELWHSTDGAAWTELDTAALLGEGAIVSEVTEGGPGLVAVGFLPSGDTRQAVAWTSADGEEWNVSPLGYTPPTPERPFEVTELRFWEVAAGSSRAVIAASVWEGFDHDELEPNVAAALPEGLRPYAAGNGVMIDPWRISVSVGPFEVFSDEIDNLDVNRDLFDAYERSMNGGGQDAILFVTDDYRTWLQVDDWPGGNQLITAMTATADGYLADTWFWGDGGGPFESADGVVWAETELPAGHGSIGWFGTHDGRLLMLGDPEATLWESDDGGSTWTAWAGLPGGAGDVRVGDFGLVAWGEYESDWWNPTNWPPTVVESGGLTLTARAGKDGLTVVNSSGRSVLTADLIGAGAGPEGLALPSFIAADHDRAVFTVVDPDSGDLLMTVTYREMQDAYELAQGPAGLGPEMFVTYSADGRVWSEQPMAELAGVASWIGSVAVGDDFAVMVVSELDGPASLWRATSR